MPKPDKVLRSRPLKEVPEALRLLKMVALFHPDPIVMEEEPEYCVCRKGDPEDGSSMMQCEACFEWFHYACIGMAENAMVVDNWTCTWCLSEVDKQGRQRWVPDGKKRAKLRHHLDTPKHRGIARDEEKPRRFTAPLTWEGKVAEVVELARRAAVKKHKLTEAVERMVAEGGHHLVDAEGMAGLERRPVDDCLIDEMVDAEIIEEDADEPNA